MLNCLIEVNSHVGTIPLSFLTNDGRTAVADDPYSLRVNRDRFIPLASLAVMVALAMGTLLGLSRHYGYYLILVSACYAFLPVLGLAYVTIVYGRCRNQYLAVGLAVLVASLTYWVQFPIALAAAAGPQALLSPTTIVEFVAWRMRSESFESFPLPPARNTARKRRPQIEPGVNWVIGISEWGGMMLAAGSLLAWRSRALYCDCCQWWTTRETFQMLPKSGSAVVEMFEADALDRLNRLTLKATSMASAWVCVEFCQRTERGGEHCPVYFSVFDATNWRQRRPPVKRATNSDPSALSPKRVGYWLERVVLDEKQIDSLSGIFTRMGGSLGRLPRPETLASDAPSRRNLAVVEKIPAGPHVAHLGWRRSVIRLVVQLSPILLIGIVQVAFLIAFASYVDTGTRNERLGISILMAGFLISAVLALGIAALAMSCRGFLESIWLRQTFKKVLRARRDRWVDPMNQPPNNEPVFVDVIRHIDAARPLSENASDIGFIEFDSDRRQLIFEGEVERYRIPAAAIRFSRIDAFGEGLGSFFWWLRRPQYLVIVAAETTTGPWQAWFSCRNVRLRPRGRQARLAEAQQLASRIAALVHNVCETAPDTVAENGAYVRTHPPKCLASFQAIAVELPEEGFDGHGEPVNSFFEIRCRCGRKPHRVLGYPRVHPDSHQSVFVGPLALQCGTCQTTSDLFDPKRHGYDAEHGSRPATLCGEGERSPFSCPHCQASTFEVIARFEYSSEGLYGDDEQLVDRAEDYFTWLTLLGRCAGCAQETHIVDFECA